MLSVDGNVIELSIEEGETAGLYNIKMLFNGVLYIAVYSIYGDFIYSSFSDEDNLKEYKLNIIKTEIKKLLNKEK